MDVTHYIIDGYNLMYTAGLMRPKFGPGGLERARERLLGVIAGAIKSRFEITVVFDAPFASDETVAADEFNRHGVNVCFARSNEKESADELIETLIRADSSPKSLGVVSNDHRIQKAARRRRAQPIGGDEFLTWLERIRQTEQQPEPRPEPAVSDDEDWLEAFEGLVDQDDLKSLGGLFEDLDWDKPIDE